MLKYCSACLKSNKDTAFAPKVEFGDCDSINSNNKCVFFKYNNLFDRLFGYSSKNKKYCIDCKYFISEI